MKNPKKTCGEKFLLLQTKEISIGQIPSSDLAERPLCPGRKAWVIPADAVSQYRPNSRTKQPQHFFKLSFGYH